MTPSPSDADIISGSSLGMVGRGANVDRSALFAGSDQLFITTGNSKSSEIIAVTHSTRCIIPADYPLQVEGAVGTFVEERPLVCGGRSTIEDYHSDCFHYNIYNNRCARAERNAPGNPAGAREKPFHARISRC